MAAERELWDAYDREGNLLGFDLVRGDPIPAGAFHLVAEVYAVTTDGQVLVTRRHPKKPFGGLWEVTGGSVLKGEGPVEGALRELREETGIAVSPVELRPVYVDVLDNLREGQPSIYHCFLTVFALREQAVRLQEGETVDWKLLPWEDFRRFVLTDGFVEAVRRRFLKHREAFDRLMAECFG